MNSSHPDTEHPVLPSDEAPFELDENGQKIYPHIRSFAKRRGHISKAQSRSYEALMPIWGIPYQNQALDFERTHGRKGPVWFEVGCGMGETTAALARARPEVNYIGVEIFTAGVGALLKRIQEEHISNIRIVSHDAVEVLRDMVPDNSLDRFILFFPDPWRKARHHKRRLLQPEFVQKLLPKLKPGAVIHCATDWEHYAHQMLEVLSSTEGLTNTAEGFAPRPEDRPLTKFEQRGMRLGHGVWDVIFTKNQAG